MIIQLCAEQKKKRMNHFRNRLRNVKLNFEILFHEIFESFKRKYEMNLIKTVSPFLVLPCI